MKRNDDLLRLAFGELSDDAARAVEARADSADRKELEAFRELYEGLRHLPPPPPDNLSAERLRAAILDRDLASRRRPALARFAGLLAPVALAALAAVVVLPRLHARPEPQIVTASDDVRFEQSIEKPRFDLDFHDSAPIAMAKSVPVPASVPAAAARVARPQASRERVASHRRVRRSVSVPVAQPEESPKDLLASVISEPQESVAPRVAIASKAAPEVISAPPSTVVENAPGIPAGAETVVIVSTKRDLETGALAATEKEVSSVLVGG